MTNSVEKNEVISSETVCKTSLEALESTVAERVFYLSLKESEFEYDEVAKIIVIFTKIIQGEDINKEEIASFEKVLENKNFEKAYSKVVNKVKFKEVSFEELNNLKEKISFHHLNVMLCKLIVKNKVSSALSTGESVNGITVNFLNKKLSNYTEIDGKIYERIGKNVFKTTLDEEVKIFIKNNGTIEEIKGIKDAEGIYEARTNVKGLENIVLFYGYGINETLKIIYNTSNKKIFKIPSFTGWIEEEGDKEGDKIVFDRKGRISIRMFQGKILFDINSMEMIGWNIVKSFDYKDKEFYISKQKIELSDDMIFSLRCVGNDLKIPISNGNLDNITIDEKKGIIKYKGIFGTKFGQHIIDLSKL